MSTARHIAVQWNDCDEHCVKSVRVQSFYGPCFIEFGPNLEKHGQEKLRIQTHLLSWNYRDC